MGLLPVSVKNTPPEKKTHGTISFKNTKSGAGEQLLPVDCMAMARMKGVCFFPDTGMYLDIEPLEAGRSGARAGTPRPQPRTSRGPPTRVRGRPGAWKSSPKQKGFF